MNDAPPAPEDIALERATLARIRGSIDLAALNLLDELDARA